METRTIDGRHGRFTVFAEDEFVGKSLIRYGDYSEQEVTVFKKCLRPGQVAIEVGANIGALTVPMAKIIGPMGRLIVYEPCDENAELLRRNLADNDLDFVEVLEVAAGRYSERVHIPRLADLGHKNFGRVEVSRGVALSTVAMEPIDRLHLPVLHFLKIDAEGSELEVIQGAAETIKRCRPILYVENDREEKSVALVAAIVELGYRLFWHRPPLFDAKNFRGNPNNVFSNIASLNMVCVPEERGIEVTALDEVADIRNDDLMFDRQIERYSRFVARKPDDLPARLMMAHCCNLMQRESEANELIAENLRRNPEDKATLGIKGLMALQRGNWEEGWPAYELRFSQRNTRLFGGHRKHDVPKWNGEKTDKRVLIWNEQGFGDSIMFARFFKHVKKRAPNAILETAPELFELMLNSGFTPLRRQWRTLPPYDLHCALPSTPAALGAGDEMIRNGPYLFADPAHADVYRANNPPRIGICHVGSPRSERPFTRDLPAEFAEKLARHIGPFMNLAQGTNGQQFESFADTAAAISALDLVITVDTSIAHLAGAMGKPVWLLLSFDPDWRWGLKGTSTIWYPSMRIFRQESFRNWQSVIDAVLVELDKRVAYAADLADNVGCARETAAAV